MKNQIEVPEELFVMITGGEYRRPLPGRGITIVKTYRPAAEVLGELVDEFIGAMPETINRWNRLILRSEKKAIRRMLYLARIKNSGS